MTHPPATSADRQRWRRYLADERVEGAVYRDLAARRTGEEREILLGLAAAEARHEAHWHTLLGETSTGPTRPDLRTRALAQLARRFGSVWVLALAQRAESRSPYATDPDATPAMAADERIHGEVVRALAERGRRRIAGNLRAAVFGANDGLLSNLALIAGIGATGVSSGIVLFTGLAGLLAGALSMAAGEYISVRSQRELLQASAPDPSASEALADLDVDTNELALVYRARGMSEQAAQEHAALILTRIRAAGHSAALSDTFLTQDESHETIGTAYSAALASFAFFASGALVPVLPYLFGMTGIAAIIIATVLVSTALLCTGATVGILSGAPPLRRAFRQLAIGLVAAAVTYLLGLLFGGHL
ncbi:MAG: rubrerythrin family protein [Candidatus Lumbricidophila eiseniae]|uniref:Rubrerythrin family protein n=1 Tax=Candidatus Lumbricidiphila eiseniae TaxID=1969409 RepID=A0A2A6FTJ8_9MICO|nr:MAG: rubrerythrin family protein [Candidatus Lumbricidophila eiseniae]